MITDRALGLPGCKWSQRQELGDERRARFARAHPSHVDDHSDPDAVQVIFPHIEGQPLLSSLLDCQHRLAGADILADLGDNHADHAVGGRAQNGFIQAALENGEGGRGRRHLRVGDGALLFGRAGRSRGMIGLRLGDVRARARDVVRGLIERLLRGGLAAGEIGGTIEL